MKSFVKMLGGAAAVALLAIGTASPAGAQPYPYPGPYHDDDDRVTVGEIVGAVATVAGAVNAVTRGYAPYGYGYGYQQPYGYPAPNYGYGYGQPNYGYGYSHGYNSGYGYGAAVNSCGAEAQRFARGGRVQIRDVDQVSGGRFRVRGTFDELGHDRYGRVRAEREGFSCLAFGDGRIIDFDS